MEGDPRDGGKWRKHFRKEGTDWRCVNVADQEFALGWQRSDHFVVDSWGQKSNRSELNVRGGGGGRKCGQLFLVLYCKGAQRTQEVARGDGSGRSCNRDRTRDTCAAESLQQATGQP